MTGAVLLSFVPLKTITPEAECLYAVEEKRICQDTQQGICSPWLAEQYEIQLLQKGAGLDCELTCLSGCLSGPSILLSFPLAGEGFSD
jgi:hypothetical protein